MRSQNFDRCLSFLLAFSATGGARKRPPLHKGAFRTGDADCRVASLLAMTVLILCHSEEAQRADVGIRLFYDGRGFGPSYLEHSLRRPNSVPKFGASVKSSAPTEGLSKSQQRADVGIGPYGCGGLGRLERSCSGRAAAVPFAYGSLFLRGEKNERGDKAWPCPLGCLWGSLTSGRC